MERLLSKLMLEKGSMYNKTINDESSGTVVWCKINVIMYIILCVKCITNSCDNVFYCYVYHYRPSQEHCLTLLQELSSCPITKDNVNVAKQLVNLLNGNVMAISCAAVTMATLQPKGHDYDNYVQFLEQHDEGAIEMYINGIVKSNSMMRHCLDFVASLRSTCPIPIPVILRHLQHPVYHVASQQALPSMDNMTNQITEQQLSWYQVMNIMKWWHRLDQMLRPPTIADDPPQAFYSPLFSYQDKKGLE